MEDSSLRSHLTDGQAQQLLDWGLTQVEETAVRSTDLSDDEAAPRLEETVTAVRGVMQMVNRLVGAQPAAAGDGTATVDERMQRLIDNLCALTGQEADFAYLKQAVQLKQHWPQMDRESTFARLMDLIQFDPDTGQEEEE
jgi:phosphoribosyl-dephospho-CoA transferase